MAYVPRSPPCTRDRLQRRRCSESRTLDSPTEGGSLGSRRVPPNHRPRWAGLPRQAGAEPGELRGRPAYRGPCGGGEWCQWMPDDSLSLGGIPVKSRSQIGHRDPNTREPQQDGNVLRGLQDTLAGVPAAWPLCLVSHGLRSPPHSRSCGQAAGTCTSRVDGRQLIPPQPLPYHTVWPPRSRTPLPGLGGRCWV